MEDCSSIPAHNKLKLVRSKSERTGKIHWLPNELICVEYIEEKVGSQQFLSEPLVDLENCPPWLVLLFLTIV